MISLVLYGRNDSYGYNLHKRAALSLNCMAEVLTHPDDEILFVDYNTPDDFPTFPEAIVDTLTEKAVRMLRVLRVRPQIHDAYFAHKTHLKALEPVSRNVAIRRSNPKNKWVLSTNTDMIFVPRRDFSLSDAVANLPKGFYCAPRFEIPETLWEGFDRLDAQGVINDVRELGEEFHLNEIVESTDLVRYDGPGDFQLISRQDLFDIHGMDEEMLVGWHVDSNISKRLKILRGEVGDAEPFVFGYHCDHTRQITPAHAHNSVENDPIRFIENVEQPDLPHQAKTWGLPDEEIEEIDLSQTVAHEYRKALRRVVKKRMDIPSRVAFTPDSFDAADAPPEHVLPFLLDIFASSKRTSKVFWFGQQGPLFDMFLAAFRDLGFENPVQTVSAEEVETAPIDDADAFIVNWGAPHLIEGEEEDKWRLGFFRLLADETNRLLEQRPLRRIVCVNAIHNRFDQLVGKHIVAAKTPFSTRIRQGYVSKDIAVYHRDWTDEMHVGAEGQRSEEGIVSTAEAGRLAFGPYEILRPGKYIAKLSIVCRPISSGRPFKKSPQSSLGLELILDDRVKSEILFDPKKMKQELEFTFEIDLREFEQKVQLRVNYEHATVALKQVVVDRIQTKP